MEGGRRRDRGRGEGRGRDRGKGVNGRKREREVLPASQANIVECNYPHFLSRLT